MRTLSERAFTLIEVLVVLVLIALLTAIVIPNTLSIFRVSLDSFARKSASLFREARDRAVLEQSVVRVRFDLDKQEYWIEEADGSYLFPTEAEVEAKERDEDKEKKKKDPFRIIKDLTKEKQKVPDGLRLASMITPRSKEVITEGIGEVYYFPHGFAEAAILHLEDFNGEKRSLSVQPITGKTELKPGFYFPAEDRR